MTRLSNARYRLMLAMVGLVVGTTALPTHAPAQTPDPAAGQGRGSRHGGRNQAQSASAQSTGPVLHQEPAQRLDAGAVLCPTEQLLERHQAAILARLNGGDATEGPGCHIVQSMLAVTVLDRHGQDKTEVKTATQTGWTDSMVHNP